MCTLTQSKIIEILNFKSYRTTACSDTFPGYKKNILNVQQIHGKKFSRLLNPTKATILIAIIIT